ncbi:plasma membrane potassium ion transmembrane transporter Trk2 [Schizosaccharomyces osmophilus]|uniref:Potassium transport protein n=1 Tax=Schizosaccharomyces osmophilus TaxID=2545709 RepID=A0AAF0AYD0_9SCHI|nr:plasma membrane potassium ion transmembrane transporter Trk2 [Schizosaccharomyces osmophilus]WBW74583.1 plasma membrane potassium ion transmembrane transporter Trk2 [Schizosaccharomyces osmophilus]
MSIIKKSRLFKFLKFCKVYVSRRFQFLEYHYAFILGMTILNSIILYGSGHLHYIDALFLASGAVTQSGIPTVKITDISIYQQLTLLIFSVLSTPVAVNLGLTVIKLYYYNRRYDKVLRGNRLTMTYTYNTFRPREEAEPNRVGGRKIQVLLDQGNRLRRPVAPSKDNQETEEETQPKGGFSRLRRSLSTVQRPSTLPNIPFFKFPRKSVDLEKQDSPAENASFSGSPIHDEDRHSTQSEYRVRNSDYSGAPSASASNLDEEEHSNPIEYSSRDLDDMNPPSPFDRREEPNPSTQVEYAPRNNDYVNSTGDESSGGDNLPSRHSNESNDPDTSTQINERDSSASSNRTNFSAPRETVAGSLSSSHGSNPYPSEYNITRTDNEPHSLSKEPDESAPAPDNLDQVSTSGNTGRQEVSNREGAASPRITIAIPPAPDHERKPVHTAGYNKDSSSIKSPMSFGRANRGATFSLTNRTPGDRHSMSLLPSQFRKTFTSALPDRLKSSNTFRSANTSTTMPFLSYQPTVGRNSAFYALSGEEREELAGIEYQSLKVLTVLLTIYFLLWHVLGLVGFLIYIYTAKVSGRACTIAGINRGWWAAFTSTSLFNNIGFALHNDSLNQFQKAIFPQVMGTILILTGNTFFPIALRLMIWCSLLFSRFFKPHFQQSLIFLLEHPRRSFTLLFPPKVTWYLTANLVGLNLVSFFFFMVLNLSNQYVEQIPVGYRIMNGIFQNASTRAAGFTVVDIGSIAPALIVSYMFMMYISAYIAMSIRQTNVYEERSLGIYAPPADESSESDTDSSDKEQQQQQDAKTKPKTGRNYLVDHLQRQLSHDLWYMFFGFFLITILEGSRLQRADEPQFTLFSILFEVVSGYGTVGLSLGYGDAPSLSAQFRKISKLVMIALEIRGRHRGLPSALDRAVLMPSDKNFDREEEDYIRKHGKNK